MKRTRLALKCCAVLLAMLLGGCSAAADTATSEAQGAAGETDSMAPTSPEVMEEMGTQENAPASLTGNEIAAQSQRKIIRNADFSLETLDYDQTIGQIEAMVERSGGYIESSSASGRGAAETNNGRQSRWANYTVRIPAENLEDFGQQLEQCGSVTSSHYSTQEVTDAYYDAEARLQSLQLQEERLLEILSKAESLEEVITLESSLADVRYQIESLQGSLRRMDSLIALSTVNIDVREVLQYTTDPAEGLGSRISAQFSRSVAGIRRTVENGIVFVVGNIIPIVLVAGIAAAIVVAVNKKKRRGSDASAGKSPNDTDKRP